MTEEEIQRHALRLLAIVVEDIDYSIVYEDDVLPEDTSEEDWKAIHDRMVSAQVFVSWPGDEYQYQVMGPEDED